MPCCFSLHTQRYVFRVRRPALRRPLASISSSVGLRSYPNPHPSAGTTGSDNLVAFTTKRYHTEALIVQGPGAGPEATAGGVFAELLRLASYADGALFSSASSSSFARSVASRFGLARSCVVSFSSSSGTPRFRRWRTRCRFWPHRTIPELRG